jgi:hypothetical protein
MVNRCAAPLAAASPSASARASANRIHRVDARVRRIGGSYNDSCLRSDSHRSLAESLRPLRIPSTAVPPENLVRVRTDEPADAHQQALVAMTSVLHSLSVIVDRRSDRQQPSIERGVRLRRKARSTTTFTSHQLFRHRQANRQLGRGRRSLRATAFSEQTDAAVPQVLLSSSASVASNGLRWNSFSTNRSHTMCRAARPTAIAVSVCRLSALTNITAGIETRAANSRAEAT